MKDIYDRYRLSGLWHVHTERTDGKHSLSELVSLAVEQDFPIFGLAEHVRRELTYDFDALYHEANRLGEDRNLRIAVGCEAKVLDVDGTLDATAETLKQADIVYAAYHGTPLSRDEYLESILTTMSNPAVDVWAHPFDYAKQHNYEFTDDEYATILESMRENEVRFELNLRKPLCRKIDRTKFWSVPKIVGYDLHDISRWGGFNETNGYLKQDR